MKPNTIAANVLGTIGTICWTGQLIPQIWKTWRDKNSEGLSPWLMLIWAISAAFLGVYTIMQHLNLPLQIQPQLFGFLGLISWGQCLYYDPRRQNKKCASLLLAASSMILVGALQVLLVFVSRPAYDRGITAPAKFYAILSAVLTAVGLLPQYWEIYKRKEVLGISYLFIFIDALGGLFNDLSLLFGKDFDAFAAATYTLVIVMDSAILIAAAILNPRARRRREREATTGMSVVIGATTITGITESPTASSVLDSPTDTIDVENKGEFAEVTVEEKHCCETSKKQ